MGGLQIRADGPTLVFSGALDVRCTASVRQAIYTHLHTWDGDIVLDLHDVTSVDLTALRVIAAASRRALDTDSHIVVRGVSPQVLRMLHLSHLIRVVELERAPVAV